jgi:quinol-cytochrome oxidoreductase complex cytochrome b subunit
MKGHNHEVERRKGDRRKTLRRKNDRRKRMAILSFAVVAFILLNVRIAANLLSAELPGIIISMGLALPIIVTLIIIMMLLDKIVTEIKTLQEGET